MSQRRRIMTGDEIRNARCWFFPYGDWRVLVAVSVTYLLLRML